jgi:hypothetical protein
MEGEGGRRVGCTISVSRKYSVNHMVENDPTEW